MQYYQKLSNEIQIQIFVSISKPNPNVLIVQTSN